MQKAKKKLEIGQTYIGYSDRYIRQTKLQIHKQHLRVHRTKYTGIFVRAFFLCFISSSRWRKGEKKLKTAKKKMAKKIFVKILREIYKHFFCVCRLSFAVLLLMQIESRTFESAHTHRIFTWFSCICYSFLHKNAQRQITFVTNSIEKERYEQTGPTQHELHTTTTTTSKQSFGGKHEMENANIINIFPLFTLELLNFAFY